MNVCVVCYIENNKVCCFYYSFFFVIVNRFRFLCYKNLIKILFYIVFGCSIVIKIYIEKYLFLVFWKIFNR